MFNQFAAVAKRLFRITLIVVFYKTDIVNGDVVPVYTQQNRTDTFLYATELPALDSFSVCFWMFGVPDDDDYEKDPIFSIASPGSANEFYVRLSGSDGVRVRQGQDWTSPLSDEHSASIAVRFLGWNQHCFSMTSGQNFTWYSKPSDAGSSMKLWFSTQLPDKKIRPYSSIVLLLDQDCHDSGCQLGGFEFFEIIEGRIALFSMWDYELTYDEIKNVDCLTQGNLLSMSDLSIMGPAGLIFEDVPCTPVSRPLGNLGMLYTNRLGVKLLNNTIMSLTSVPTASTCIFYCAANPNCYSVNYWQFLGLCELNGYNKMLTRLKIDRGCTHHALIINN